MAIFNQRAKPALTFISSQTVQSCSAKSEVLLSQTQFCANPNRSAPRVDLAVPHVFRSAVPHTVAHTAPRASDLTFSGMPAHRETLSPAPGNPTSHTAPRAQPSARTRDTVRLQGRSSAGTQNLSQQPATDCTPVSIAWIHPRKITLHTPFAGETPRAAVYHAPAATYSIWSAAVRYSLPTNLCNIYVCIYVCQPKSATDLTPAARTGRSAVYRSGQAASSAPFGFPRYPHPVDNGLAHAGATFRRIVCPCRFSA